MRLNLNDNIKIKLTEHGKRIYYHQYDRLNNAFVKPSMPKVDEDGYTTFPLWCFMELYGDYMGMTFPNVIEPLDIVFDAPTIEPECKKGKWIEDNGDWFETMFRCSECGAFIREQDKFKRFFCHHCGADMRGKQDG